MNRKITKKDVRDIEKLVVSVTVAAAALARLLLRHRKGASWAESVSQDLREADKGERLVDMARGPSAIDRRIRDLEQEQSRFVRKPSPHGGPR